MKMVLINLNIRYKVPSYCSESRSVLIKSIQCDHDKSGESIELPVYNLIRKKDWPIFRLK